MHDELNWTTYHRVIKRGIIADQDISFVDVHKPIPPAFYEDNEEWVQQYREQFGTEPAFF